MAINERRDQAWLVYDERMAEAEQSSHAFAAASAGYASAVSQSAAGRAWQAVSELSDAAMLALDRWARAAGSAGVYWERLLQIRADSAPALEEWERDFLFGAAPAEWVGWECAASALDAALCQAQTAERSGCARVESALAQVKAAAERSDRASMDALNAGAAASEI